jgi:gamma-glutamylcyclotransferase (GGCT)/AIG2-like uncharacterized protein YtfP
MTDWSLNELIRLLDAANTARWRGGGRGPAESDEAERALDARFGTRRTLAVYGTLAPGRSNHHVVAPLGGEWTDGQIEGDLHPTGWGAILGYPAFCPRPGGPAVAVKVLTAAKLPSAWREIDRFEGPEYRRILVPVFHPGPGDERRLYTVANLYAAAEAGPKPAD